MIDALPLLMMPAAALVIAAVVLRVVNRDAKRETHLHPGE